MTQGRKFCTNCGATLIPNDRFCSGCGQPQAPANPTPPPPPVYQAPPPPVYNPPPPPVYAPPPPVYAPPPPAYNPPVYSPPPAYAAPAYAPPQPPGYAETLIGMIPSVLRKKNLLGNEGFAVMVTQRRMIFAIMTTEMITKAAKEAGKEGGFLMGILNSATVGYTFYKRYLTMPPDVALAENPQNFAIERSIIRRVKVEAGKEIKNYYTMKANQNSILQQHNYDNGKLEIETVNGNFSFDLPPSSTDMALDTLRKAGLY